MNKLNLMKKSQLDKKKSQLDENSSTLLNILNLIDSLSHLSIKSKSTKLNQIHIRNKNELTYDLCLKNLI